MKTRNFWRHYLLLAFVAVSGFQTIWKINGSATGWRPHLSQWTTAAASLVGIERRTLENQEPLEQAHFWLHETERNEPPKDDSLTAMGAAWMLDTPQLGFLNRHVQLKDGPEIPGLPASWRRELDYETIAIKTQQFESLCHSKCLNLIENAAKADADNVELHRAKALLLFQPANMGSDLKSRYQNPVSILDECLQFDSQNALYDYLAALHLWTTSADYDWQTDGYLLKLNDPDRFQQGNARLAAGLKKRFFQVGTQGYASTLKFLETTSISKSDGANAVGSRQISSRAVTLLYRIMRWQNIQADMHNRAGQPDAAVRAFKDILAITDQVTDEGNYPDLLSPKLLMRRWSLANLQSMHNQQPTILTTHEARDSAQQLLETRLDLRIHEEVARRMMATAGTKNADESFGTTAIVREENVLSKPAAMLLMSAAQLVFIVCIAFATLAFLLSVLLTKGRTDNHHASSKGKQQPTFGWSKHTVVWLAAFGISFVPLGIVPAELVSAELQTNLIRAAIWITPGTLLLAALYAWQQCFKLPIRQTIAVASATLLPVIAIVKAANLKELTLTATASLHPLVWMILVLAISLTGFALLRFLWQFARNHQLTLRRRLLSAGIMLLTALIALPATVAVETITQDLKTQTWIRPTSGKQAESMHIDAEELQAALKLTDSNWAWAFVQWQAHNGPVISPLIAIAILLAWHWFEQARRTDSGFRPIFQSQIKHQLVQSGRLAAGSSLTVSILMLGLYLAMTPATVDLMDNHFVRGTRFLQQPAQTWQTIAQMKEDIKADQEIMKRLEAEIEQQNPQSAE